MELSKEQIKYIEHRLRDDGIKFWDIRIEMLDHVVSDVEKSLKSFHTKNDFHQIVQESVIALGWKENFNGGGFEGVFRRLSMDFSKRKKKNALAFYKQVFTNQRYLTLTILFWLYLFIIYPNMELFKYTLILVLTILGIGFVGFVTKYNIFKSIRLRSLLDSVSLPLTLMNVLLFCPKVFFGYNTFSNTYLYIVCGITIPFLVFGIYFLYKEFRKTEKVYKKLIS